MEFLTVPDIPNVRWAAGIFDSEKTTPISLTYAEKRVLYTKNQYATE